MSFFFVLWLPIFLKGAIWKKNIYSMWNCCLQCILHKVILDFEISTLPGLTYNHVAVLSRVPETRGRAGRAGSAPLGSRAYSVKTAEIIFKNLCVLLKKKMMSCRILHTNMEPSPLMKYAENTVRHHLIHQS